MTFSRDRQQRGQPWHRLFAGLATLCLLASGCALKASANHDKKPVDITRLPHSTLGALIFSPQQGATNVSTSQSILVQTRYTDAHLDAVTVTDAAGGSIEGTLAGRSFEAAAVLRPDGHYSVTATVSLPQGSGGPGATTQETQTISFSTVTTPHVVSVTPTALPPAVPAVVSLDAPASEVKVTGPATAHLDAGSTKVSLTPDVYKPGDGYAVSLTVTGMDGTVGNPQSVRFSALGGPTLSSSPSSSNLGVGMPFTIQLSKPPASPAAFVAHLVVETDAPPTVALPGDGGSAGATAQTVCLPYARGPQPGGTLPISAQWNSSRELQLLPKTADGYWPPNATIRLTGSVDGLSAVDGSQFSGTYHASFKTGDKRVIDVNLSSQTLTACRNGVQENQFPVSTGRAGKETPAGNYFIYSRILSAEMKGGTTGAPDAYDVKNVPFTQYFHNGDALHGAYWHNNFGHPMSHGCVNISTPTHNASWPNAAPDAEYLWNFDNYGDPVIVHGTTPA